MCDRWERRRGRKGMVGGVYGGDGGYEGGGIYGWMEEGVNCDGRKEEEEGIFTRAKWCRVIQVMCGTEGLVFCL